MARMRTLKPEFWDSPSTANASLAARLLFLAMWNWADDSGRGTAGLKELEAFAFPNDDVRTFTRNNAENSAHTAGGSPDNYGSFAEVCGDVSEAYGVQFYRVKSRPYYRVPSFKEHQAKDFRLTSKYPKEDQGEFFDVTSGNVIVAPDKVPLESGDRGASALDSGNSAHIAGKKNTVIGEKGKRVIGEKGNAVVTLSDADAPDGENDEPEFCEEELPTEDIEPTPGYPADFTAFWDAYPRRGGKGAACASFVKAKKRASIETIIAGALRIKSDPNLPTDKSLIPMPATWLNQSRWDDDPLPHRSSNTKQTPMDRVAHTAQLGHQLQAQYDQKQIGTNS